MANSDKNILITPSVGLSASPTIKFTGSGNTPTTLRVLDDGTISFEGTAGQLFSISDGLSGSIFSVNDISGIPSVEVLDTGLVKLNQYGGSTVFGASAALQSSSVNARVSIQSGSVASPALIVRAFTSSSANIQEWHRADGYLYAALNQYGSLYVSGNVQVSTLLAIGSGTRGTEKVFLLNDNAANVGLIIKGAASQTANLQEWQNSAGTVVASMRGDGLFNSYWGYHTYIQPQSGTGSYMHLTNNGILIVGYNDVTNKVFTVKGMPGQTGNLQEWQNSDGTTLAVVGNTGTIRSSVFANLTPGLSYIATNYDTSGVGIVVTNAAYKGLVVRGAASQTGDLQQWQDSAGTVMSKVNAFGDIYTLTGRIFRGSQDFSAGINVLPGSTTQKGIVVRGVASQTADLQQWQDSAGTTLARISSSGFIYGSSVDLSNYGSLSAVNVTANQVPLTVIAAASQTADLQQWQDNALTTVAKIDVNGNFKGGLVYNINDQTGTSYTFALSDSKAVVTLSNANNITASIPTNSTAFPIGSSITIVQYGLGQVTIQALTPGTTTIISNAVTPAAPRLRGILSSATLIKASVEGWIVIGDVY